MYKLLLCWRYLRTRWIALASVVSVTLGVATMIVVNAVMAGFSHEMQDRIHGILSDIVFSTHSDSGFQDPDWHMREIRRVAGDAITGMTPTVTTPAMISFQIRGQNVLRPIMLVGIDEATHAQVSDFGRFLQHPDNRRQLSFDLREGGYDTIDSQADGPQPEPTRPALGAAGWGHRRRWAEWERLRRAEAEKAAIPEPKTGTPVRPAVSVDRQVDLVLASAPQSDPTGAAAAEPAGTAAGVEPAGTGDTAPAGPSGDPDDARPIDPFRAPPPDEHTQAAPGTAQFTGVVPGFGLMSFRDSSGTDRFLKLPGDDVKIMTTTAGTPPKAVSDTFTVVDFYESKMSEYDTNFVFVPIAAVQRMRGMIDPQSGLTSVNQIQIRLAPGADLVAVRDRLRRVFSPELYDIATWRDRQGPLLAAVEMEMSVLNILLFLIIAVAGFGILAIFFMIVVEKTKDIGILKSLGAGPPGIAGIFLGYGLFHGLVGAGAGLVLGLAFVRNLNQIRHGVEWLSGRQVFDPSIYYFHKIPTIVDPATVVWIIVGAVTIAVAASVLPALRAARLHPVEALRHD
ncbi:MAG: ABC transporter permease [Planctomycetia bacterium]